MKKSDLIYQFKITLRGISPPIWRRVQVPAKYSFWDLHVAIQDSMGWLDYHLHAFHQYKRNKRSRIEIGIPDDDFVDHKILPGWEIKISEYFIEPGVVAAYEYDFGDGWNHEILLEGILLKEEEVKYPQGSAWEDIMYLRK